MEPITLSFISKRSVTSAKFEGQQDKIFNERAAFVARFSINNSKIINQPVILSGVELLPSEERGKSAKRLRFAGSRNEFRWLVKGM